MKMPAPPAASPTVSFNRMISPSPKIIQPPPSEFKRNAKKLDITASHLTIYVKKTIRCMKSKKDYIAKILLDDHLVM